LFFLNRNDELSARDVFAVTKPPFSQYQYGATLSGPIRKDKTLFFTSFERLSVSQNNFVTISDFALAAINRQGFNVQKGVSPFALGNTSLLARVDTKLTQNNSLWVRYNFGGTYNGRFEPFGGLTAATAASVFRADDHNVAVNNTYINAGLNLVNETRYLFNKRDATSKGVIPGPQTLIFAPEGAITFGPSTSSQPLIINEYTNQIVNNTSLLRGRHQIKFGFDFLENHTTDEAFALPFNNGFSLFGPIDFAALTNTPGFPFFTGLEAFDPTLRSQPQKDFLTFLAGVLPSMLPGFPNGVDLANMPIPTAFIQGFGTGAIDLNSKAFSAFVQNDIRVRPEFLLKLGIRYDIQRAQDVPKNDGNFSPRIALAYNPKQIPNLNIRAAYGIFFARVLNAFSSGNENNRKGLVKTAVVPLPFSVLPYSRPGHNFPDFTTFPPDLFFDPTLSLVFEFNRNLRNSYSQQAVLGIDYYLNRNTLASINYNYVRGLKLFQERNVNPIVNPDPTNPFGGRVDPTRGDVIQYASDGDSYYHALTVALERRFTKINFLAFYTLAKAIDNFFDVRVDLTSGPVNPLNIRAERGLSNQDIRHRFVLSGVWELSYTKNPILRDFQLSSIVTITSGTPFNLLAGVDLNGSGDNPPSDRPLIGGVPIGRNAGEQPGFASLDLRLSRKITINEKLFFEGFIEGFNFLNRTNISQVDNVFLPDLQGNFNLPPNTGNNGRFIAPRNRYRNAFSPRQLQFGLRFNF
ncbi:MAG: TonB-dependent receptor, partial [Acidobacteriota bacterium]